MSDWITELTSNGKVLGEVGIKREIIAGRLLFSAVACSRDDLSRHVVEKGEHQVQALEEYEVDQPFVVYG